MLLLQPWHRLWQRRMATCGQMVERWLRQREEEEEAAAAAAAAAAAEQQQQQQQRRVCGSHPVREAARALPAAVPAAETQRQLGSFFAQRDKRRRSRKGSDKTKANTVW
jgi:hypothetical protein